MFEDTNVSAFPNIGEDESTQIDSQLDNKKEKKVISKYTRFLMYNNKLYVVDNSFLSENLFDNSLDDLS